MWTIGAASLASLSCERRWPSARIETAPSPKKIPTTSTVQSTSGIAAAERQPGEADRDKGERRRRDRAEDRRARSRRPADAPSPNAPSLAKISAITRGEGEDAAERQQRPDAALAGILDGKKRQPAAGDHEQRSEAGKKRQDGDDPLPQLRLPKTRPPAAPEAGASFSLHAGGWVAITH